MKIKCSCKYPNIKTVAYLGSENIPCYSVSCGICGKPICGKKPKKIEKLAAGLIITPQSVRDKINELVDKVNSLTNQK
jgi:hypothetical protein